MTQDQLDDLVCSAYNVGNIGAVEALRSASQSNNAGVVSRLNPCVYIHPCDAHGQDVFSRSTAR
ncbi:hypothetical protein E2P84_32615 [Burkholderia cepacia]|uniref:Lysozyme n=1 Tax=Burkholderia cepacia TaxID=292 RepID=A0AAX2RCS8_BURCE|nr:hypothetical protein [Burkholderia cepacia]TES69055.1 hypothetical protein E2P84_32615 [Burkholderia cepacia]TEU33104.1 hypothetical protein E3D39_34480 [Burkholderia cepacia]TEU35161.1 hypothetical protein E3D37_38070 [Burkholderia cepacia]TEU40708.1 hypothetical protein E3D38_34205 [Burkholderia cepacia]TEU64275.1 hypothetical protein E3D42_36630 [Burkholderia cepacia]